MFGVELRCAIAHRRKKGLLPETLDLYTTTRMSCPYTKIGLITLRVTVLPLRTTDRSASCDRNCQLVW